MNALKCPGCHQSGTVSQPDGQRAICRSCSKAKRRVFQFCCACQREWPRDASSDSCMLPNCALRAALLSVQQIDEPHSSVKGCPYFRACPGCKALLTHNGIGCPNIVCPHCGEEFCFRCLKERCIRTDDSILFWGLILRRQLRLLGQYPPEHSCRLVDNTQSIAGL